MGSNLSTDCASDQNSVDQNGMLNEGYRAMAADVEREAEAREWCDAMHRHIVIIDDEPVGKP